MIAINPKTLNHAMKQHVGCPSKTGHKQRHDATSRLRRVFLIVISLCITSNGLTDAQADDSAAAPAFDIGALASIASNLGSNPQIMSMVSSFLNQGAQKPGPSGVGAQDNFNVALQEQDTNSITQDAVSLGQTPVISPQPTAGTRLNSGEPLKRGSRMQQQQQQQQAQVEAASSSQKPTSGGPSSGSSSTLGSLVSMLPSVLPGLNLSGIGSLLGMAGGKQQSAASTSRAADSPDPSAASSSTASAVTQPAAVAAPQPVAPSAPQPIAAPAGPSPAAIPAATGGSNPAQSVINQVLTAYAAGQIPNELIQLSLSGRVPPQIIELALSGQVPPQMIQMIITGQVPMSTINAFLQTFQQVNEQAKSRSSPASKTSEASGSSSGQSSSTSSPGVFATTRSLFESLFGLKRDNSNTGEGGAKSGITVPTFLGPIPLKMPSFPNMRSFGQLVGGTISNMASMIPF